MACIEKMKVKSQKGITKLKLYKKIKCTLKLYPQSSRTLTSNSVELKFLCLILLQMKTIMKHIKM